MSALLKAISTPAPVVLAPTGMVPTRAMTPHVPITPGRDRGATWRRPRRSASRRCTSTPVTRTATPTWSARSTQRIVGAVREAAPDVLINVSTSGRTWSEVERRADCPALDGDLKPDLASLTLSSLELPHPGRRSTPPTRSTRWRR